MNCFENPANWEKKLAELSFQRLDFVTPLQFTPIHVLSCSCSLILQIFSDQSKNVFLR